MRYLQAYVSFGQALCKISCPEKPHNYTSSASRQKGLSTSYLYIPLDPFGAVDDRRQ